MLNVASRLKPCPEHLAGAPARTLVVDQDDDDGGQQAVDALAEQLGKLPRTLSHRTPHGVHRIYRTPPGRTPRAWVGKDARNPLPPGIDLRVPGQILMAPPSRVPAEGALVGYRPVVGGEVAELPAAYVSAWTLPTEAACLGPVALVPTGKADAAAAYVKARIAGIIEDLAEREPGGRNTAIYTAALKVGSTLGAVRSTPGAENAVAAWPEDVAEEALMAAAECNGYIADHSAAAARSAIRSGLRNGLRSPRPLPEFSGRHAAHLRERGQTPEHAGPTTRRQEKAPAGCGEQIFSGTHGTSLGRPSAVGCGFEPGRAKGKRLRDRGERGGGSPRAVCWCSCRTRSRTMRHQAR